MPPLYVYFLLFAVGLVATIAATPLAKALAKRVNAIDYPSARRINTKPIPRLGGVAMFLGLCVSLVVLYVGTLLFDWPTAFTPHHTLTINYRLLAVAVLVMFLTGLVDDIRTLKPMQKFAGQLVAAALAAAAGLLIGNIVNPFGAGELDLGWFAYPITVFYLVAFANIINLIDGLDGLAAGVTAIAGISLTVLTALSGQPDASTLAIALAGCCIGFLRYNFHPASIFMGDSGALTLGFLLGIVALLGVTRTAAVTTLIVPLVIAGIPILDTFAAIVRRKRGHTGISTPDKGHIQHRLLQRGLDQRRAALVIYAWSAMLSVGAFVITQVQPLPRVFIFVALLAVSAFFLLKLHLFDPVCTPKPAQHDAQDPEPNPDAAQEPQEAPEENEATRY